MNGRMIAQASKNVGRKLDLASKIYPQEKCEEIKSSYQKGKKFSIIYCLIVFVLIGVCVAVMMVNSSKLTQKYYHGDGTYTKEEYVFDQRNQGMVSFYVLTGIAVAGFAGYYYLYNNHFAKEWHEFNKDYNYLKSRYNSGKTNF